MYEWWPFDRTLFEEVLNCHKGETDLVLGLVDRTRQNGYPIRTALKRAYLRTEVARGWPGTLLVRDLANVLFFRVRAEDFETYLRLVFDEKIAEDPFLFRRESQVLELATVTHERSGWLTTKPKGGATKARCTTVDNLMLHNPYNEWFCVTDR